MNTDIAVLVLAAGRGSRMKAGAVNKVVLPLAGKPMIVHTVEFFKKIGIATIVVVVGFAKESIQTVLGDSVIYAEQKEQRGTGDAVACGMKKIPQHIEHVLVVNGDDSAFYKHDTIRLLLEKHIRSHAAVTFLTTRKENPFGIGRIVRLRSSVLKIVEEKDATDGEKAIQEVNVGCYIFQAAFLRKYIQLLEKSTMTGEYYITGLIDLALKHHETVETIQDPELVWHGINTPEDLEKAEQFIKK